MSSDNSPASPVTMQFEYDPERLIEEVKKRPGIWDYEDVNYRAMATRVELWNEVVHELLQPNVKVSRTEMRELVLQLQKKWKSLKDSFQKYVQNPNRTKRPYLYSRQLEFLVKNIDRSADIVVGVTRPSESEDALVKKKKRSWKSKKRVLIKNEDQTSDEENDSQQYIEVEPFSNEDERPLAKMAKSKTTNDFAFASVTNMDASGEDCDKMFLLSLLPHLKSIPEELRLNAKMELLRVLRNANQEYGCSSTGNMIV